MKIVITQHLLNTISEEKQNYKLLGNRLLNLLFSNAEFMFGNIFFLLL